MSIITVANAAEVDIRLQARLETIEKSVKTKGISETQDVSAIVKDCFNLLKKQMEDDQELDQNHVTLTMSCLKVFFAPSFSIAKDLKGHQANPSPFFKLTWCDLCNIEQAIDRRSSSSSMYL